jgi:carbonic anhydrase
VQAAIERRRLGLIDNWLRHIQDVQARHRSRMEAIADPAARANRLCELNVIEQVANVCQTSIVLDAWDRGQSLAVHGWIYGLSDGLIRDLGTTVSGPGQAAAAYHSALAAL